MTSERQFIEITNGRWWYEDKVGEVMKVERFIEEYKDEALGFEPTKAYAVERSGEWGYVLAEDCREWEVPKLKNSAATPGKATDVDMVNHPNHYTTGKFETIEIIEAVTSGYEDPFVSYNVGNTQKYIARAPFKGKQLEDLKKARKYLDFAIDHLVKNEN
jgi:hypothetical protein